MAEKAFIFRILRIISVFVLGIFMILSVWQPVFPSSLIIKRMVKAIDPQNIALIQPAVIRFELSGKGGGIYSIVAEKDAVKMVKGKTDRTDLIVYMEATEFNNLVFTMASGKAEESSFMRLVISDILSFAGDRSILETLFKPKEAAHEKS